MSDFDYGQYYSGIVPLADATRSADERCWSDGTERPKQRHDYVLYLGCNVLRTVALAETMVAILEAMEVDFVPLAGPSNCCGIIHHGNGDFEISEKLTRNSLAKFAAYRPKAMLMYCPSCHFHIDGAIPERNIEFDVPYLHVTEFLVDNIDRIDFRHRIERRVALHAHRGSEQQDKDAAFTRAILGAIPGLEVIELAADDDWGRHCSRSEIARVGIARHNELADAMFAAAFDAGADAVVAGYHSCYRQLCHRDGEHGMGLIHYTSLIAEAMGIKMFSDSFKEMKLAGDAAAAYRRLEPAASKRGVNLARLEAMTRSSFAKPDCG
jgi:Fe-S oxidoreductase